MTPGVAASPPRVAYMMARFPKLTETFVLDEILEMQRQGIVVEVFPLWRERATVIHPDAAALVERAQFLPTLSFEIIRDVLQWLVRHPRRLAEALGVLIWENRRSPRFLLGALAAFPKSCSIARRMQRLGVHHLHAHFASHPAAAAWVVSHLTGISWSFTAHGSDLHREQAMLERKVRDAKFVVAISDYNRRFIVERVPLAFATKVHVVHCGVDASAFEGGSMNSDTLQIVCIGTLHEVKGQRYLLEACAQVSRDLHPWRCHLVGDGPDRDRLRALVQKLDIADHVVFHGACTREQVRALLTAMNIACAPSVPTTDGRREGIPVALMEAGACALPLIASRLSGIPELVVDDETGILVEPGDVRGLACALQRLAREPHTRRRLGEAARLRVVRDFSLVASVAALKYLMLRGVSACSR